MRVIDLGANVSYDTGLAAMRAAMAAIDDDGPALVLLEHAPTITITRRGGVGAFVSPRDVIEADGIAVCDADRGGDVTFHGPGQITGYPIVRLGPTSLGCDVVGFVRDIEQTIISVCRDLDVSAEHIDGTDPDGNILTGVWAGAPKAKVCAIGVGLGGGVTRHGFALNVTTELPRYTRHIVPCGLKYTGVTSLDLLLPEPPSMARVKQLVVDHVRARLAPLHRAQRRGVA